MSDYQRRVNVELIGNLRAREMLFEFFEPFVLRRPAPAKATTEVAMEIGGSSFWLVLIFGFLSLLSVLFVQKHP